MGKLNPFAISGILLSLSCLFLVIINIFLGRKKIHFLWALFNLAVGIWGFGVYKIATTLDPHTAWIWWKINHIGVIWMPVFIFHTVTLLCNIQRKKFLLFLYFQGIFFSLFNIFSNTLFFRDVRFVFDSFYYVTLGLLYHPFFVIWLYTVIYTHFLVYLSYRNSKGLARYRYLYFLIGTLLGFLGGIANFLPGYRIDVYPYGNFTIPLYGAIITYAIIKYHLMDIRIAITRAGIFLLVYLLIMFTPFWLASQFIHTSLWWFPILLMGILASLAPFIYNYLRRGAENILLAEQKRYQRALREFAQTLIFIKDTESLAKEVTSKIITHLNLDFCAFYLKQDKDFYLIHFSSKRMDNFPFQIKNNCKLVYLLNRSTSPILGESLPSLDNINVGLAFPLFLNKELFGFIVMSQKTKGTFTDTDIDVFTTVSTQVSLALSQIYYFEEYQKLVDERYRLIVERERMESAFQISEAYRHELGNIINIISLSLANLEYQGNFCSQKEDIEKVAHSIKKNVERARTIFDAIARYNKNARSKFKLMNLSKVVKDRVNQFSKNISKSNITIKSEIEEKLRVWANDNLPDAIGYLIEGSIKAIEYHAPQNKCLYISLKRVDNKSILKISDTGGDITKDNLYSNMGIERGKEGGILYFIARRIVFDHKGSFDFQSFNQGEGTTFKIELPINEST